MRYKFVEDTRTNNVTHIAFDGVDEVRKKFYGVAYYVGYLRMDWARNNIEPFADGCSANKITRAARILLFYLNV